jgi:hypothetical protein
MDGEELGLIEDEGGTGLEESGDESGEEEITEGEEGGEEGAEGGEEEGGEELGEEERGRGAVRTLPTELRKALREFNTGNPDFAKRYPRLERQLTAALYKASQADGLGGLPQLRAAAQLIESHGGAESIAQMAEEVEAGKVLQEGMQQGDPVLLDIWSREHPDGFKAMVGPSIAKLEAMDLAAHDRALADPIYRTLDRCGVIGTMNDLERAIAGEDFDDIRKQAASLKNFLLELKNFASRAKAPDPLKADRERIDQERAEIQTERQRTFYGGVRTEVGTSTTSFINRALRQELAGRKLQVSTANRLRKQINEDLAAAVNTAPGYAERYKAVMKAGDHQRAVNFIVQTARQKIPLVVKRVLRDFNLGAKPGARGPVRRPAGGSTRSGGTGQNVIAGRPKTGDVDFTRTDKSQYLASLSGHGQAYLRNGKVAKW